jgi:hypothetical protein
MLPIALSLMTLTATSCATSTGGVNAFCVVVGPPPPEMIPAPGEPAGWIDTYLAVFDATC